MVRCLSSRGLYESERCEDVVRLDLHYMARYAELSLFRWCDRSGLIAPAVVAAWIVVASHAEYEPR